MATPYNHKEIEKKWRHNWDVTPINKDTTKPKYYCLDMFPLSIRIRTSCRTLERICY